MRQRMREKQLVRDQIKRDLEREAEKTNAVDEPPPTTIGTRTRE